MVYDWLSEYAVDSEDLGSLKDFLQGKLDDLGLGDVMVDTTNHDSLDDEISLVEMILLDVDSYGQG